VVSSPVKAYDFLSESLADPGGGRTRPLPPLLTAADICFLYIPNAKCSFLRSLRSRFILSLVVLIETWPTHATKSLLLQPSTFSMTHPPPRWQSYKCWFPFIEDEPCRCAIGQYQCKHADICIPAGKVCDGTDDCPDHDDEMHCGRLKQFIYEICGGYKYLGASC